MIKYFLMLSLICMGATSLLQLHAPQAAARRPAGIVGGLAPEFGAGYWIDAQGQKMAPPVLRDLKGQAVVLFFFQDWCPGCQDIGFPNLKKMIDALPEVKFFAIQTVFEGNFVNTSDKVRKNQIDHGLKIPMAHDDGAGSGRSRLATRYRAGGTPWVVIIDPKGRVIFNDFHINPDRAIPFLQRLTSPTSHDKH